jgi:uncharacterized coiled-coil protein SlyX
VSLFDGLQDPLTRLEELELMVHCQGMTLEEVSEQFKSQAHMLEQLSGALVELAQALNSQHRILMDQARHIRRLENENNK